MLASPVHAAEEVRSCTHLVNSGRIHLAGYLLTMCSTTKLKMHQQAEEQDGGPALASATSSTSPVNDLMAVMEQRWMTTAMKSLPRQITQAVRRHRTH